VKHIILMILVLALLNSGCSHRTSYEGWERELSRMPRGLNRVEDVSMLLGVSQSRCEQIEAQEPLIGIRYSNDAIVTAVEFNSPAQKAGILKHDKIISLNNLLINNGRQLDEALKANSRDGEPLRLVTSRGAVDVTPRLPKAEQCYWEVDAGQVTQSGSGGAANDSLAVASSRSLVYQRFFKATCRVFNGFIAACNCRWQR